MSRSDIKRIWLGIVAITLVSTYPSWANRGGACQSSYDAPWVYPGVNPAVQLQLPASRAENGKDILP